MIPPIIRQLAGKRANRLFLIAGICISALSLYQLLHTAMYVHEAVVVSATVTDVRQKPFESISEALRNGTFAWGGAVSFQPIVRYTVPNGLVINRMMTDSDTTDYTIGQQIEIITPELDPSLAHVNKWKFIWGWECIQLSAGVISLLLWLFLKGPQPKVQAKGKPKGKRSVTKPAAPRKRTTRKKKQV